MTGDWIDTGSLQAILLGVTVALVVGAALVWRVVRRLLLRLTLVALIGTLAAVLWLQRANLSECVDTCSCRILGWDVAVPADANPNC